jgi:hypothetical protein
MEESKTKKRSYGILIALLIAMTIVLLVRCSGFLANVMASMIGGGIVALTLDPFTPGPPLFREENSLYQVNPYDDIDYVVPNFVQPSPGNLAKVYGRRVTGDSFLPPDRRKMYAY